MTCVAEGDALLRAVLADPGDDTVRLVYADWLQENGHETRAEFIRTQCELARTPEVTEYLNIGRCGRTYGSNWYCEYPMGVCGACRNLGHKCNRHALEERVERLFADSIGIWGRFPKSPITVDFTDPDRFNRYNVGTGDNAFVALLWERGFVRSVRITAEQWVRHADELLARNPITDVTLTTPSVFAAMDATVIAGRPGIRFTIPAGFVTLG